MDKLICNECGEEMDLSHIAVNEKNVTELIHYCPFCGNIDNEVL